MMQITAIALPWYEAEDYPRILQVMEDADTLPRTHAEFVKAVQTGESRLKAQGVVEVVRAVIKPDEFLTYCRMRNLKVDSKARMQFGNEVARDHVLAKQAKGGADKKG